MSVEIIGNVKADEKHNLIDEINSEIFLDNTYHLYLNPGYDFKENHGLRNFMR